ncbi:hypothetical protein JST97_23395 [bacterium]|nr:hypothetical protein [bacterium]
MEITRLSDRFPLLGRIRPARPSAPAQVSSQEMIEREQDSVSIRKGQGEGHGSWTLGPGGNLFEAGKPDATLAVIDQYGIRFNPGTGHLAPDHGELVAALALQASGKGEDNLLRVDNATGTLRPRQSLDSKNFGEQLDQGVAQRYANSANNLVEVLGEIYQHHPNITTITQSQGQNGPQLTEELVRVAQSDPAFGSRPASEVQLPEGVAWASPQALKLVAERVQRSLNSSPEVASALDRLHETLDSHPQVAYFNSAGNSGQTQRALEQVGFRFDPRWEGNFQTVSSRTHSIAAAYPARNGTATPAVYSQMGDQSVAFIGEAKVLLDGQPVCEREVPAAVPRRPYCVPFVGTSFAAPKAAGLYDADPIQYERLRLHSLPPGQGVDNLGVGLIDFRG